LKAKTPDGGHCILDPILCSKATQKKDQKKPKKKQTSDVINNIILIRIDFVVPILCWPEFLSRVISRHHTNITANASVVDVIIQFVFKLRVRVASIDIINIIIIDKDVMIGQGLVLT